MESIEKFRLPVAPTSEGGPVKVWIEPVEIPTYAPMPADKNPMFLERRVYQGSSGKVYPLPFIDRISAKRENRLWQAVHLENKYLRLMVLPEIGGRIHVGLDKTNGYDFFYRQNVIKPALVGLAGPWISGGVEFNWPQHHRPATFMPVMFEIERHEDGSRTIWCGDHDPMNRMKGMHGVCLHPDKAYVELKVRLYNRTPLVQTFLWWANVATHVNENYQSFFPPDVHYVADHAKRAISKFPFCEGRYYGVDYGQRAQCGVAPEERPAAFVPPGTYAANDLRWYANIPVPTSYMALGSTQDFFGGYDHGRQAGLVHFADHHIAPGKKQWTWGNHNFGYAWDRNLTDSDGPYVELMAGVYTDNQPDFSFLGPGETKAFSQFWYPISSIGIPQNANLNLAISLNVQGGTGRVGVYATRSFEQAVVVLEGKEPIAQWTCDIAPGKPFIANCPATQSNVTLQVLDAAGHELISYSLGPAFIPAIPTPAAEPPLPEKTESADELYLTGLHLAQYRHATRQPDAYWKEALRRDSGDARCNNAMGLWHLRRGEFDLAESHFRAAVARLTRLNPNPYDGEPFYNLGLALGYLGRDEEAYDAFFKATWNQAWRGASYHALAELNVKRRDWSMAAEHLQRALAVNRDNLRARNLLVIVFRSMGDPKTADEILHQTLALDPLDIWALDLSGSDLTGDNQLRLDLAIDYARAGLYQSAQRVLENSNFAAQDGSLPIIYYALGHTASTLGEQTRAIELYAKARNAPTNYCFPSRLEELLILESAIETNPADSRAHYYLGNLLYDKRRHGEAIEHWETAARLDDGIATVWRNLGIGYYNVRADPKGAHACYEKAFERDPSDARVFYELDQLHKRIGVGPRLRLKNLERHLDLVSIRDDLSVELATLYNQTGRAARALEILNSRQFQPWEGGEGLALAQYVRALLALGRDAFANGRTSRALECFEAALETPPNLGEARHLLANRSNVYFWLGAASSALGQIDAASNWWTLSATSVGDFQEMSVRPYSEMTFYNAMALKNLGRVSEARSLLVELQLYANKLAMEEPEIDYFATSLPSMLLFDEDLQKRNQLTAKFLRAQAALGLDDVEKASRLLDEVLTSDPNHGLASDLRQEMTCQAMFEKSLQIRS
jgi:tetratricopeptide (TPR) repeat protein